MRVVTRSMALRRALAAAALAALVPAAALAVPIEDYESRVARAVAVVESVYDDEEPVPAAAALEQARALLPPRETVEFDGRSIEVDNGWLVAEAEAFAAATNDAARDAVVERVAARLYAIDVHLDALHTAPEHATAEERAKLEEILSRREFQPAAESPIAKAFADLRRRVGKALVELLQNLFGGGRAEGAATVIRVVVVAAGLLAIVILLRAVAHAVARRRTGDPRKRKKKRKILGEEVDESTTSSDLAAAARALAAKGDLRGAVRKLFVALIYQLDERGLVRLRSEATNREYLALVRGLEPLHPVMASMTDVFERVWYGSTEIDRAGYDAFEAMHAKAAAIVADRAAAAKAS